MFPHLEKLKYIAADAYSTETIDTNELNIYQDGLVYRKYWQVVKVLIK